MHHQFFNALGLFVIGLIFVPLSVRSQTAKVNTVSVFKKDKGNFGCKLTFKWMENSKDMDFQTLNHTCPQIQRGFNLLTIDNFDIFKDEAHKVNWGSTTRDERDYDFVVISQRGKYCYIASLTIGSNYAGMSMKPHASEQNTKCDYHRVIRKNYVVCQRLECVQPTTTTTTTTKAPSVALTTATVAAVVRMGALGITVDNEILIYRILLCVFFVFIIILIIMLIRTCAMLRRANTKHSISDGRSHVSIRRVTDAGLDQYSSMAGIGDTSSLTAPELYGSIARRKEMNRERERKAWLRDHACAGSHIGVPPSEDMNGLLHPGSIHRTSISSLSHPCESLNRVPGMRSPPGTYPVRPPACQLSRQNTGDSLHYRGHVSPQPMMPSPGINGHSNPMNRDDLEGHMV